MLTILDIKWDKFVEDIEGVKQQNDPGYFKVIEDSIKEKFEQVTGDKRIKPEMFSIEHLLKYFHQHVTLYKETETKQITEQKELEEQTTEQDTCS